MPDQPQDAGQPAAESSVEDRLAAFFGGPKAPESSPNAPIQQAPVQSDTPPTPYDQSAQDAEVEGTEEEAPAEPYEEVDWEGEKYRVPAKLKPALMMQADYTRKTQELAVVKTAIDADRLTSQANAAFIQQVQPLIQEQQRLLSLKEQAKKIDWTALTTDQKIDLDRELRTIDNQLLELGQTVGSKKQEYDQFFGQAVLQAVSATEHFMAQKVPGWSQAAGNQLHDYGLQHGIPKVKLTTGWFADPVATHIMWKAQQWDQLQSGKPQLQNRASNAPPAVKPGSNAVQKSTQQSNAQRARDSLRKTGSLQDAAAVLLSRMK